MIDAAASLDRWAGGFERAAQGLRRSAQSLPSWLGVASLAFHAAAAANESNGRVVIDQ